MQAIVESSFLAPLVSGILSLIACSLIVVTQHWHGTFTHDRVDGVQKFHTDLTPRIGGLPIMLGLSGAFLLVPPDLTSLMGGLLIASIPALLLGLAEDLSKRISAGARLFATLASGFLACFLYGSGLNRIGVWGLDIAFQYWPVSFAFTAVAIAGMANSINIVDGFNGLASGVLLISLSALGFIAFQVGDQQLASLCLILGAATLGFMVLNFPLGKIFLGDGGAYLMGFALAWTSVLLLLRNPEVSVWAPLLACGYPVIEVMFSIWRRRQHNMHPFSPDSLHLHSLMKVRLVMKHLYHLKPVYRNAVVSPLLWAFAAIPALASCMLYRHTWGLFLVACLTIALYWSLYRKLERRATVRHAKTFGFQSRLTRQQNSADSHVVDDSQQPNRRTATNSRR